jgi:hypothetical protein
MKKSLIKLAALFSALVITAGCSTTAQFKLPPDTTLKVTGRDAKPDASGKWQTSPFFWTEISGAKYWLMDSSGKVIRSGKLKTQFRVVSVFWPPAALAYWPVGFAQGEFDLTKPGDGFMVKDDMNAPGATSVMPAKATDASPAATPPAAPADKKKAKKAKKDAAKTNP